MSFTLPDTVVLPTSPERHNIAIAEIVIFTIILPVQLGIRYIQIQNQADRTGIKNPLRVFARAWLNFVVVFGQIRIVGFALYLGVKNPSKGIVIAEVVLQSVGLSPLLLELSFTLLRCGRAGFSDQKTTNYPKVLKILLQSVRVPIIIGITLIIVAASNLNLSFLKAGATVLLATYVYIAFIALFIAFRYKNQLTDVAQLGLWIAIASLPLYAVRVVYLMLVEFGDVKFDPVVGDWRHLVGLGLAMEVGIVVLLMFAGIAVEPFQIEIESNRAFSQANPVSAA